MAQILSSKELAQTVCILLNNPAVIDEDPTSGVYARFMTQIAQALCNFYDAEINIAAAPRTADAKVWFVAIAGNRVLPTTEEHGKFDPESARLFWQELFDSVESLTAIADQHGPRTLADLFCLQNAILTGGFIDHYPGESNVLDLVRTLFSAAKWERYIKVEYLASAR